MKTVLAVLLSCAAVASLGLGIAAIEPATAKANPAVVLASPEPALEQAAPRATPMRVMPTVYVTADPESLVPLAEEPSVMLDTAVDNARFAMVGGAARGAKRIGMVVPYFTFAQASAGATE